MATLRDLANQMDRLIDQLPVVAAQAKADTAKVMVRYLIHNTPVDTSFALSNWIATWGVPSTTIRPAFLAGKYGSTYDFSTEEATISALTSLSVTEPGRDVFLTNNVEYIRALNNETAPSRQPGFFVEGAELLGREFLKTYSVKLPESL